MVEMRAWSDLDFRLVRKRVLIGQQLVNNLGLCDLGRETFYWISRAALGV